MSDKVEHTKTRRRPRSQTRRVAEITGGILLLIFSPIIGGPIIPGPFGFIGSAMGLALVLRNSRWARKRYIVIKRRHPKIAKWVDLGLRRRKRSAPKPSDGNRQQREQYQP